MPVMANEDIRVSSDEWRGTLTEPEQAAILKERVYATFTGLAILLPLAGHAEELGAGTVAAALFIGVLGIALAGFLSDVIAHLSVHKNLPSRRELTLLIWVAIKAMGTVLVPLILLGLAGLDVMRVEAGVRASVWVLIVTLGVIGYFAVRRSGLPWWKQVLVLLAEVALGGIVVGLELLAHA